MPLWAAISHDCPFWICFNAACTVRAFVFGGFLWRANKSLAISKIYCQSVLVSPFPKDSKKDWLLCNLINKGSVWGSSKWDPSVGHNLEAEISLQYLSQSALEYCVQTLLLVFSEKPFAWSNPEPAKRTYSDQNDFISAEMLHFGWNASIYNFSPREISLCDSSLRHLSQGCVDCSNLFRSRRLRTTSRIWTSPATAKVVYFRIERTLQHLPLWNKTKKLERFESNKG